MAQLQGGDFCPLLKKDCVGLKCKFFVHLRGKNPQSGNEIDEYDCAVKWLPLLLIENAQMSRQTGAAVESFRNEMVRQNSEALELQKQQPSAVPLIDITPNDS